MRPTALPGKRIIMRQHLRNALAVLASVILFSLAATTVTGEGVDLTITSLDYTNDFETGDPVTIVQSGRDAGTVYKYNFYDDDDDNCGEQRCIPENWYAKNFDDAIWDSGAAPFGNNDQAGASPGTMWQTEDDLNDHVIIRHHFTYNDEYDAISATLNLAYNNYYVAYLNGNLIRDCYSYQNNNNCYQGDAAYWNNELTYDGGSQSGPNQDWLVEGDNVLAILGRDSTWGGDPDQWLDVELVVNVQSWREKPIILGDDLWLRVITSNVGNETAENFSVTLEIEGEELGNTTITELAPNATAESVFYWTPEALGDFNLMAFADAGQDVGESDENNNTLNRTIHIGFYAYNLTVESNHVVGNVTEIFRYNLTVTNEGDVEDNFTLSASGIFYNWDWTLTPSVLHLQPGEGGNATLEIVPDRETLAGNYSVFMSARSQYYSEFRESVVLSGRDNETEWWWAHSNSSNTRLYYCTDNDEPDDPDYECDISWTELDFDYDDNWTLDPAPFGDTDIGNVDNNTVWQGNSYAYFRHIFTIDNISAYEGGSLSLNTAANNYGTYYLNSQIVFNDMRQGQGHTANYWNDETLFGPELLQEGENILASVVRETGNTQWFDEEVVAVFSQSAAWDFVPLPLELEMEVLPTYNFSLSAPISNKQIPDDTNYTFQVWITNLGNIGDTYEMVVTLNDTYNFTILNYTTTEMHSVVGEGAIGYINVTMRDLIEEDARGGFNVTVISRNSTEQLTKWIELTARLYIVPDTLRPVTEAITDPLVNSTSFQVGWEVAEWYRLDEVLGNDTLVVTVEYRRDNGSGGWEEWQVWQVFTAEDEDNPLGSGSGTFSLGEDGRSFQFRATGLDDDGLLEDKTGRNDTETLVDTTPPTVAVSSDPAGALLSTDYLELSWESSTSDLAGYDLQHSFDGGAWETLLADSLATRYDYYVTADGSHAFRVIASDDAGNRDVPDTPQISMVIDTAAPTGRLASLEPLTGALAVTLLPSQDNASSYNLSYARIAEEQLLTAIWAWQELGSWNATQSHDFDVVDGYAYYFRYTPVDAAGNVADRDSLSATYSGDGNPGQSFPLLLPAIIQQGDLQLTVHAGLTELARSNAPGMVLSNQFYYDTATATIQFGNGASGYLPTEGESITIAWSGYDAATLVDRTPPSAPRSFELTLAVGGTTAQLRFLYSASDDVVEYRIIRKDSPNATGDLLTTLAHSEGYLTYVDQPPGEQLWIYRVIAVDRRGQLSPAVEATVDLTPAVQPLTDGDDEAGLPLMTLLAGAALVLGGGAAAWWFTRPPPVAIAPVLTSVASPFTAAGAELACDGCGTVFAPDEGETLHCPGCGQVGPPPS
ncbi:MAG: CARDB domain-containing protein [Candidatus Poseidoniia archaeon]|nr:CARDB domain-containing protein [Candidatus Poseidoniia archaeon]MDP7006968.1 CARDB domain-containing protein [Candidatus Poseidoniia archaeon]